MAHIVCSVGAAIAFTGFTALSSATPGLMIPGFFFPGVVMMVQS